MTDLAEQASGAYRVARMLVRCYPRRWRRRYGDELLAVLEQHQAGPRTVLNLAVSALSTHLDPAYRMEGVTMVWLRRSLQTGPFKAGVLTSLGFGHVSAMVAVAHPGAFVASLTPAQKEEWLAKATARLVAGEARRLDAMTGGAPLFEKAEKRRFASADAADTKADETAMLVDPAARLGDNGIYARASR